MAFEMAVLFFLLILPNEILANSDSCNKTAEVWSPLRKRCEPFPHVYIRLEEKSRLEVSLDEQEWGTVCADFFDENDAKVVCRYLGHPVDSEGHNPQPEPSKFVPDGNGTIHLDSVGCYGNETNLGACFPPPLDRIWGVTDCFHNEDVGVKCGCDVGYTKLEDKTCGKCTDNCLSCDDANEGDVAEVVSNVGGFLCDLDGCNPQYQWILGKCITKDIEDLLASSWQPIVIGLGVAVVVIALLLGLVSFAKHHCFHDSSSATEGLTQSRKSTMTEEDEKKKDVGEC